MLQFSLTLFLQLKIPLNFILSVMFAENRVIAASIAYSPPFIEPAAYESKKKLPSHDPSVI